MNHNAMQGIGDWALPQKLSDLNDLRLNATYYKVFCCLAKLIKVKSATLQRFQLAFKHLLLLEKNSRLHPIFQDIAFNFHTFSRSGKVVRKFPDFFKNSRLCTNPACERFTISLAKNATETIRFWLSQLLISLVTVDGLSPISCKASSLASRHKDFLIRSRAASQLLKVSRATIMR